MSHEKPSELQPVKEAREEQMRFQFNGKYYNAVKADYARLPNGELVRLTGGYETFPNTREPNIISEDELPAGVEPVDATLAK